MAAKQTARAKAAAKKKTAKTQTAKTQTASTPAKRTPVKNPAKKPSKKVVAQVSSKPSPAKKASAKRATGKPSSSAPPVTEAAEVSESSAVGYVDASESAADGLHEEAEANGGVLSEDAGDAAWDVAEPARGRKYEPPDHAEAEAAVSELRDTPLSRVVDAALRFVTKERPWVQVFPTCVIGAGPAGIVMYPAALENVRPEGHVVDGYALRRMLKNAGSQAVVRARSDGGLEVLGSGHRFGAAKVPEHVAQIVFPPQDAYRQFTPSLFLEAARFAGSDKIEPPVFAGVQLDGQGVAASDRASFYVATGGVPGIDVVLPRNTFDGITEPVWLALNEQGNLVICVPSTSEYRMVVPYHDRLPDVREVASTFNPEFWVEVDRNTFEHTIKSAAIVQRRTSALRFSIFVTDDGAFLEVQAGDTSEASFTSRMDAVLHGSPMLAPGAAAGGMAKVVVSGDLALRLVKAYPHPTRIMLGFGREGEDVSRMPVVVATEAFKAVAQVMR